MTSYSFLFLYFLIFRLFESLVKGRVRVLEVGAMRIHIRACCSDFEVENMIRGMNSGNDVTDHETK